MSSPLTVYRLGRVEYADGLNLQALFSQARRESLCSDTLLLLEHPAVLTLGRGAKSGNVLASPLELGRLGVSVHPTDRGGDVTYHGPGQLVGYPLLHLGKGQQDVRKYVRRLEEVLIATLAHFQIAATRVEQWPGVWVEQSRLGGLRKIAALGVHLSRWYTRHGFALNVAPNLEHFSLIVPCGIREAGVTSMAAELGSAPGFDEVQDVVTRTFGQVFDAEVTEGRVPHHTVSVAVVRAEQVLALKRTEARGGFWQLVTGRIEPGESAAAAAARELTEETGAAVGVSALDYRHAFAFGDTLPPVLVEETAFVARVPAGTEIVIDPHEHVEQQWLSASQAEALMPFEGLKEAVRRAFTPAAAPPAAGR